MKVSKNEHGILNLILIFSSVIIFLIWLGRNETEWFPGAEELAQISNSVCLGYLVAYMFYYINIYRPQKRKFLHDCYYIGDYLSYIAFNKLQLSDLLNGHSSKAIFLGSLGNVFMPDTSSTGNNQLSVEQKRYSHDLKTKLFRHIRENLTESEVEINKLILRIGLGDDGGSIITGLAERSFLNDSFVRDFTDFGARDNEFSKEISKRALNKLKLLNESKFEKLAALELGIKYGEEELEFKPRNN